MIALALLLLQQQPLVAGQVTDATAGAPLAAVAVRAARAATRTDDEGRFALEADAGDTIRFARVGYRSRAVVVGAPGDTVRVVLDAIVLRLRDVDVVAAREGAAARLWAARDVGDARGGGAQTLPQLLATLPYVVTRAGAGGVTLSMRGSRAGQVLVLLDGMPLNDPAVGSADVSDLPLAALGTVTALPGTDAARWGSGATGGVLSLSSGGGTVLSVGAASFGGASMEGAGTIGLGGWRARVGGSARTARNDFDFLNTEGAGRDTSETRVNADERSASLFASAASSRVQLLALATRTERGLGAPMNVRGTAARERVVRALARTQATLGSWSGAIGLRALDVAYRDSLQPTTASGATALSADGEVARDVAALGLRAGGGADRVAGNNLTTTVRPRLFAAASREARTRGLHLAASARLDAVRDGGVHLSPALAVERPARVTLFARAAQGFRVPTFYDLYVASPLGIEPRVVAPERVVLDAEAGLRILEGSVLLQASGFTRLTRDAIVWLPGSFTWSPRNVERERVDGAEARASAARGALRGELWAGAYLTRARIDGQDVPTPYAPSSTGGAMGHWTWRELALEASVTALGRRAFIAAPRARALELPGVVLADLTLSRSFPLGPARALVSAGVRDLTDRRWEAVRRYPTPGRSWTAALTITP